MINIAGLPVVPAFRTKLLYDGMVQGAEQTRHEIERAQQRGDFTAARKLYTLMESYNFLKEQNRKRLFEHGGAHG